MQPTKAAAFVEDYLYRAQGHRALAASVFAEGERRGFSEARLRRAGAGLGLDVSAVCWALPLPRSRAIEIAEIESLTAGLPVPALRLPDGLAPGSA